MSQANQRGFFGIVIPEEILNDQDLNITEKFIYGYIASFRKCCFQTNDAIGERLGISESTIAHTLPKLQQKGYIFIEKANNSNNKRQIYSVLDNPKKLAYLAKKKAFISAIDGCGKNVENSGAVMQNLHDVMQNMQNDLTGVRYAKFADIDIEENIEESKNDQKCDADEALALAGDGPASASCYNENDPDHPDRGSFSSTKEYLDALGAYYKLKGGKNMGNTWQLNELAKSNLPTGN